MSHPCLLGSDTFSDRLVFFLNSGLELERDVLFMSLEELSPNVVAVVLVPQLLQLLGPLLALYLLLDQLARLCTPVSTIRFTFVVSEDIGTDDFRDLVLRKLVN